MPRSTVSTAVQALENHVGARLLYRTTRKVSLTQDGAELYDRGQRILAELEEMETLFQPGESRPRGKLNVDAPSRIARRTIAPALPDFFARHPEIEITLGATDRPVDLVQEGVDCAIRVGDYRGTSLVTIPLGKLDLINCASPGYLSRHGTPRTITDLATHLAVNYASPFTGRIDEWEYLEDDKAATLSMKSVVTVNNAECYIACCLAGLGLIQVPAYDVSHYIESGQLVEVLPEWRAEPVPIALLYPHRQVSSRLQAFTDWVTQLLGREVTA